MSEKIMKCPICNQFISFLLEKEAIDGRRVPVPLIITHGDHNFIAYLDSELSLCDIEKPVQIKADRKIGESK
ncbi:MAG: hypothetical protein LUQ65_05390 [Candidatus Helarchaeota archaeon]|nr:hypothetical protein [Candidatus Helarchaeota archaeon]